MTTRLQDLRPGVVYVWEGRLDVPARAGTAARALLSRDERARADRFVYDRHRRRYTVAQAHLRRVLAGLTGTSPAGIDFRFGRHGKPHLPGGPSFNQSHSEERIMIAVAAEGRVGVDIEEIRMVKHMLGIAARNFARDESARLHTAPAHERRELFFRLWTRKEAFLKALGVGLTHSLRSFSVDPSPGTARGLLEVGDLPEDPAEWHLGGLPCSEGAEAALAVDRAGIEVEGLRYDAAGL
ncbi:MAG: 4'-phosphopantetheinyl transferase superfamily protein [Gemmatimonadota bacterium]|nr:4'-phosphopantetheinyl transferase superfamily protein [Gemmatimonadota bacterium]MDE2870510.1 4'-phosphopantetheinyl transferase superfamily protein [Gemmatimonadota bacterium]